MADSSWGTHAHEWESLGSFDKCLICGEERDGDESED